MEYALGLVHPYIVQLLDLFTENTHFVIVVSIVLLKLLHTNMRKSAVAVFLNCNAEHLADIVFSRACAKPSPPVREGTLLRSHPPLVLLQWELIDGPDLLDLLNSSKSKKLSEPMAAFYFQQLLDAVVFMHNNGFCHQDLKAENCVIDSATHTVKVIIIHYCPSVHCKYTS